MSIEPICDYCGYGDKNRCKSKIEADNCSLNKKPSICNFCGAFNVGYACSNEFEATTCGNSR